MFKPTYSDLKPVRDLMREDIHKALCAIWDEHGVSIAMLGKLERVESRAYSETYEWFCERD